MNTRDPYKHICGYPIPAESRWERCPGCGGRITPWNTRPSAEEFQDPLGSGDDALDQLAIWLSRAHPELAAQLLTRLQASLAVEDSPKHRRLLNAFHQHLDHALHPAPQL